MTNFEWTKTADIATLCTVFGRPVNCGLTGLPDRTYEEPVSVYAESNIEDTIKCWGD